MGLPKLGLAATVVALVGCTAEGPDDPAPDDEETKRQAFGVVTVERVQGDGLSRASVSAKFMRVAREQRAAAEALVGGDPLLPSPGECGSLAALEEASVLEPLPSGFSVELLDVGDVSLLLVEADGGRTQVALAPRAFPDVGDWASGVFYTTPEATLPAGSSRGRPQAWDGYEIAGSGAASLDAFVIEVGEAPDLPEDLRIDAPLHAGRFVVSAKDDLALSWRRSSRGDVVPDVVYVDVLGADALRCAFPDTGSALLPAGVLSAADVGAEATVSVHRLSERLVRIASVDGDARVRFDLASAVRVTVK